MRTPDMRTITRDLRSIKPLQNLTYIPSLHSEMRWPPFRALHDANPSLPVMLPCG
jgi:hypothetical protein